MSIYKKVMGDRNIKGADRALLSLIAGEICIDGKPMDDDTAIKRLSQMVKVCCKNVDLYTDAGNTTMALAETVFRDMIEVYLPKGASEEDIKIALLEIDLPKTMKSMGRLMGHLKQKFAVVDGNLVKSILMGEK